MTTQHVDLAIIGGGAAGLGAAREARRRGASAVLINDGPLGGDCTFTGCVPSKALIEASLRGDEPARALAWARDAVAHIAATETAEVLRAEGVDVIDGTATLVGPGRIEAGDGGVSRSVEARGVVLALGGQPHRPPIPGLDQADPLTTDTVWDLDQLPGSLAIIGGGPAGCELGQALARLGVTVTLIEADSRLLPGTEARASDVIESALVDAGVEVHTATPVTRVEPAPAGSQGAAGTSRVHLEGGAMVEVERILVATGRQPPPDRAGLAQVGVVTDRDGWVQVGSRLDTSLTRTWAAGDITGLVNLTSAADHMGRLAAANSCRRVGWGRFRAAEIPRVVCTRPEVAWIGLSEAEAAATVPRALVAELPLAEHDRALAAGRTEGYLKLISAPRPGLGHAGGGRLIGATVVADRAGELIAELALAIKLRAFVGQLALTVHPYPSWSYAIPKAAAQFFTEIEGRTARQARA